MDTVITAKDFELTDSIKNYINEKVKKLNKQLGEDFESFATIKIEGNHQIAEIRVNAPTGEIYKAVAETKDLYASIDKDIEILEGQIRKTKTKKDKQNMTDSIRLKEAVNSSSDENAEDGEIIKTAYYDIKPLTVEDAKLELEARPRDRFFTFVNVESGRVNVIFKLKDGKNYGLIEPEA